jgi:hypothetical protein
LSITNRLRLFQLCHLSRPAANRAIYKAISGGKVQKIVELGVDRGQRALRMIEVAKMTSPEAEIQYIGMDLFESRPNFHGPGTSLKEVHQLLRGVGARIQLVPGNPSDGLVRLANSLGKVDLLIVPEDMDSPTMARVWYFVPRMLHAKSLVFVDCVTADGQHALRQKSRQEVDRLASASQKHRAAA